MTEQTIPKNEISRLEVLVVGGDLFLTGWNRDEIRVKDLSPAGTIKEKKNQLSITSSSDVIIHIPHSLEVSLKSIGGDASIKGLGGAVEVDTVGGDLSLSDVGSGEIAFVGGDLIASRIQGNLKAKKIGGDALVENATGQIALQKVGGDLQLSKVAGGIEAKAGGNARISFNPVPWQAYRIEAGGDISASIPDESSADLSLKSTEADITVILGDLNLKLKEKELKQQIGEGGPSITLLAGGKIFLTGDEYTWVTNLKMNAEEFEDLAVNFSAQTAEQIKEQLGKLEEELQVSLSGLSDSLGSIGISEENLKKIADQIEESGRLAAQKAETAALKAQARVEKHIAKARRQALKIKAKTKEFDLNEFLDLREQKKSVSNEERLLILNMLQEKKISPEEADDLLKALEGKKKT